MPTGSEQFRQYVTSTAFSLNLSLSMIAALEQLENYKWHRYPYPEMRWQEMPRALVASRGALERRGLMQWLSSETGPQLTEAGRLVLELCRLAGLAAARPGSQEGAA